MCIVVVIVVVIIIVAFLKSLVQAKHATLGWCEVVPSRHSMFIIVVVVVIVAVAIIIIIITIICFFLSF